MDILKLRDKTMPHATIHCYAELNDFLPVARRAVDFVCPIVERGSIKDLLESLGIPHPEIALLVVNGVSVDFGYLVHDQDRIDAYPVHAELRAPCAVRVPLRPTPEPRFVLDIHLGRLAAYLRMMGFDALYPHDNDYDDENLARISHAEDRILLTRDLGLLKRGVVTHGYFVRSTDPQQQVGELLRRFALFAQITPFRRCIRCNGLLHPTTKDAVYDRLAPLTRQHYDTFWVCASCDNIYWRGSHHQRMQQFIDDVRKKQERHDND